MGEETSSAGSQNEGSGTGAPAAAPMVAANSPLPQPAQKRSPNWALLKLVATKVKFAGAPRAVDKVALGVLKLCRAKLPLPGDLPSVRTLAPFEVDPATLSPAELSAVEGAIGQLEAMGFVGGVYSMVRNSLVSCDTLRVAMRHESGQAIARVTCHFARMKKRPDLWVEFYTQYSGGEVIMTWPRGFELEVPAGWMPEMHRKVSVEELWAIHQKRIGGRAAGQQVVPVLTDAAMKETLERHQRALAELQLQKGIFVPLTAAEQQQVGLIQAAQFGRIAGGRPAGVAVPPPIQAPMPQWGGAAPPVPGAFPPPPNVPVAQTAGVPLPPPAPGMPVPGMPVGLAYATPAAMGGVPASGYEVDGAVMAEIVRLQTKQSSWVSGVVLLVVSLALFAGLGMSKIAWDLKFLGGIVAVLFIHELGHFLAMRLSGYRNLKMFFIPFFGAAVSGQNHNVPGWKKVVVSLMGPVPGILLAVPVGILAWKFSSPMLAGFAYLLLLLNAMNLLPILPMDGGWVLHHLLFSRNIYLDVIFRGLAIALILFLSVVLGLKYMYLIAIPMVIGLPVAFKLAKIVQELRAVGFVPLMMEDQTITPEAAGPIAARLQQAFPKGLSPRVAAQHTISVVESLNARPPGAGATVALLGVHVGAFFGAVVFGLVLAVMMNGGLGRFGSTFGQQLAAAQWAETVKTQPVISPAFMVNAQGEKAASPVYVVATYESHIGAKRELAKVEMPEGARACVFGSSVLIGLAKDDQAAVDELYSALSSRAKDTFVSRDEQGIELQISSVMDEKLAEPIAEKLNAYLTSAGAQWMVAPWDPQDFRTFDQKQKAAEVQKVCKEVEKAFWDINAESRELMDLNRKALAAYKRGDREEAKKIDALRTEAYQKARMASFEKVVEKYPEHQELMAACREVFQGKEVMNHRKALAEKAKPWLMEIPDGTANVYGVRHGHANAMMGVLSINLNLLDPIDAAPAVVQYLQSQGCKELHYEFRQGYGEDYEGLED